MHTGIKNKILVLLGMLGVMWAIQVVNSLGGGLIVYGIVPREVFGLRGILFAPFLHGSFMHLLANSVPFLILGWLVVMRGVAGFVFVTVIVMLTGGLGTWGVGSTNSVHVGASVLIFGYLGFLISRGFFEGSIGAILIALAVGTAYGSLVFGILPGQPGISWQGHLFGLVGGIVAAKILATRKAGWQSRSMRTRPAR